MGITFRRVVHDMRVWWCCGHQSVAGHVLMFAIIGGFEWMMEWLVGVVVRAYEEVLHVFHAWSFEPAKRERISG